MHSIESGLKFGVCSTESGSEVGVYGAESVSVNVQAGLSSTGFSCDAGVHVTESSGNDAQCSPQFGSGREPEERNRTASDGWLAWARDGLLGGSSSKPPPSHWCHTRQASGSSSGGQAVLRAMTTWPTDLPSASTATSSVSALPWGALASSVTRVGKRHCGRFTTMTAASPANGQARPGGSEQVCSLKALPVGACPGLGTARDDACTSAIAMLSTLA